MVETVCPKPESARPVCNGTYNTDVLTLADRYNRFIAEAYLSESASIHHILDADLARFNGFNAQVRSAQGWINIQPQTDNPSTYPRFQEINSWDSVPTIENDGLRTMIRGLEIARDELIMCQSSRIGSGLLPKDNDRLTANIDRTQALIDIVPDYDGSDYVATTPLFPVLSRNVTIQA